MDEAVCQIYRMRIYASFEDNTPDAAHWLQECFSKVFHQYAVELALRGCIQFEELYYNYYVKSCVEGPLAKLQRLQEVITKFQDNQPIYKFNRVEFSEAVPISHYHYHLVKDKYDMWYDSQKRDF
ncbi:hypothetical protein BOX15_Mlig032036g1 [Macrostomum lignano]|uniref:Uncharacterized protein n=1 Tax=Macrostomum lignano TaxID=282301 RepID=A0A267EPN8_9PLAT|nr:hypothetical protein BOX15_Mlig032036g1 [Macrostomum lignano]